ncbi:hypothetical protein D3C86_1315570 [compost metagenome]
MNDRVLFLLICSFTIPLSDTRSAGIGEHFCPHFFESRNDAITLDGITNLLRSRVDPEFCLRSDSMFHSLLHNGSCTRHIFIRRVGTRSDQAPLYFHRPTVCQCFFFHFGNRRSAVRSKWSVDMRFQSIQVDLDQFIKV